MASRSLYSLCPRPVTRPEEVEETMLFTSFGREGAVRAMEKW